MPRTEARIDLAAIRHNVAVLRDSTSADVMAVVKADGYGHGLVPSARAAVEAGASWLGTAIVSEALALRAAGLGTRILSWLWTPDETEAIDAAVAADIDLSVSTRWQLDAVSAAAARHGRPARVHLKIDTGLSRNGAYVADWPDLVAAAAKDDQVDAVGVWSHFAYADAPGHPTIAGQIDAFREALDVADAAGRAPGGAAPGELRGHAHPARRALRPRPTRHRRLRADAGPAGGRLRPRSGDDAAGVAIAAVKRVGAGEGVSYGHTYTTARETTLALVPLGYADGVPRHASNVGPVAINGRRFTISGRVCMDQIVVDVGDLPVVAGDSAVLWGPGTAGEPLAQDWADALDTIHYELVTRVGPRVTRTFVG